MADIQLNGFFGAYLADGKEECGDSGFFGTYLG
jgi:hypothetical protein